MRFYGWRFNFWRDRPCLNVEAKKKARKSANKEIQSQLDEKYHPKYKICSKCGEMAILEDFNDDQCIWCE